MAWGGHENWAADRGCHAATCSWKEIPRKRGCIHGRSSPNPAPAQVTKPAPRRIGGTQAHKLLLSGFLAHHPKSCHIQLRLSSVRHDVIGVGWAKSPGQNTLRRTALTHIRYTIALPFPTNVERMHHYQRGRTSITGLRFWLRKDISTKRLVVVVMSRLVRLLMYSCGIGQS